MNILFKDSELLDLIEKVEQGQRLTGDEGVRLFESNDLLAIGYMADLVRCRKHGDRTFFSVTGREPNSKTNATMTYSQQSTSQELVDQLIRLRDRQEQTGGFISFTPLAHCPPGTAEVSVVGVRTSTGYDDLKALAIARIMLDNFLHIKARWVQIGPKLAQVSLAFGVDSLDGTIVETKTIQDGDHGGQVLTTAQVLQMISAAGRTPVECDSLYKHY